MAQLWKHFTTSVNWEIQLLFFPLFSNHNLAIISLLLEHTANDWKLSNCKISSLIINELWTLWKISSMIFKKSSSSNNSVIGISIRVQRHLKSKIILLFWDYLKNHKYCSSYEGMNDISSNPIMFLIALIHLIVMNERSCLYWYLNTLFEVMMIWFISLSLEEGFFFP